MFQITVRTYGNIEMEEGGLQVVFVISGKNSLSDVNVPRFNVTDCVATFWPSSPQPNLGI